jgi:flagellar biosynthetic protein FliP
MNKRSTFFRATLLISLALLGLLEFFPSAYAQQGSNLANIPNIQIQVGSQGGGGNLVGSLKILAILTILTLAPAILIMTTSFTRIVIVLSFLRQAIGTAQMPPNQLVIGFSIFLTFFIMGPTFQQAYTSGIEPYMNNQLSDEAALERISEPMKAFMFRQTRERDLALFFRIAGEGNPSSKEEVGLKMLIPAFVLSELKTAFQIGFMLYLPFLVIDMVIASLLMAMGMLMLPPSIVSLPFKLLLFVLVDGWHLVVGSLVKSFG